MAVELVCPFCGFSKKTSEQMIPERARWAICPRCRQKFEISLAGRGTGRIVGGVSGDEGSHATGQEPQMRLERSGSPWENRSTNGFASGIYRTFKGVLFSPAAFFRRLSFTSSRSFLSLGVRVSFSINSFNLFTSFIARITFLLFASPWALTAIGRKVEVRRALCVQENRVNSLFFNKNKK